VGSEASSQQAQSVAVEFEKQSSASTAEGEGQSIPDQPPPERTGDADADAKATLKLKENEEETELTLDYTVPSPGEISIEAFNRIGQVVETSVEQSHRSGKYRVRVNTEALKRGTYFVKLASSDSTQILRQSVVSRGAPVGDLKAVNQLMNAAMDERYKNKDPNRAIEIYDKILTEHPNYPDRGAVHLASLYPHARASSPAQIRAIIDSTLAYDASPKIRLSIARVIAGVWNDPAHALPMVDEAMTQVGLALDPAVSGDLALIPEVISEGHTVKGALLARQGKDNEALNAYSVALQAARQQEAKPWLTHRLYDCHRKIGLIQERLGHLTEATRSLEEALLVYESITDERVRSRAYGIDAVKAALERLR